jgi:hypothetical protein
VRWKLYISTKYIVAFFLILILLLSCGKAKEEPEAERPHNSESSNLDVETAEVENHTPAPPPPLPDKGSLDTTELPNLTSPSAVIISGNLGVTVRGVSAATPTRSGAELEQQLLSFLPQLHEVYDQELTRDPHGMGSLDVKMTIEPNGSVSELRFPLKRVSSDRLTAAIYDVMRTWQFPQAEGPVDVRYQLLLVPPGMDPTSIGQWEQHLAGRIERDRSEKTRAAIAGTSSDKSPFPAVVRETKKTKGPAPLRRRASQPETERSPSFPAQWYQVTRPTELYASPTSSASVITRFQPGKRVWVIGVVGSQWLEVRSVKGRRPGFLPRENAKPEQRQRAQR